LIFLIHFSGRAGGGQAIPQALAGKSPDLPTVGSPALAAAA
jgi:hypothetical protein